MPTIKEAYTDLGGNVTVEYNDDSTVTYNHYEQGVNKATNAPATSDILLNVTVPEIVTAGRNYIAARGTTAAGILELSTGASDADNVRTGGIQFADRHNTYNKNSAFIGASTDGTTAGQRGGQLVMSTKPDGAATPSNRFWIRQNGEVGIGTATTSALLTVAGTVSAASGNLLIAANGNVTNTNNSYGAISDIKLKENIEDCGPKLDKLMQIRIVNYNLKSDPTNKQIGVIAQELEQVMPSLVQESPDYLTKTEQVQSTNEDGEVITDEIISRELTGTFTKSVKYSVLVPILVKALQEQQQMIQALTTRISALE